MNTTPDPTNGAAVIRCHKCGTPVVVPDGEAGREQARPFVRLRCSNLACGYVDWYSQSECEETAGPAETSQHGHGGVWIHDSLLGLSFKDPTGRA